MFFFMSFKLPYCRRQRKKKICLKLRKEIVKATQAHTVEHQDIHKN